MTYNQTAQAVCDSRALKPQNEPATLDPVPPAGPLTAPLTPATSSPPILPPAATDDPATSSPAPPFPPASKTLSSDPTTQPDKIISPVSSSHTTPAAPPSSGSIQSSNNTPEPAPSNNAPEPPASTRPKPRPVRKPASELPATGSCRLGESDPVNSPDVAAAEPYLSMGATIDGNIAMHDDDNTRIPIDPSLLALDARAQGVALNDQPQQPPAPNFFSIGEPARPATPPPANHSVPLLQRSPLAPRQSHQHLPPPLIRPEIGPRLPAPDHDQDNTPDLQTSVEWKGLPGKMSKYCALFIQKKGRWGAAWARCIEAFVSVEGMDGSPVSNECCLSWFLYQCLSSSG